jgi:hypothetical protein
MREESLLAEEFLSAKALSWSLVFGCELDLAVEVVPTMLRPERNAAPLTITAAMATRRKALGSFGLSGISARTIRLR